MDPALQAKWAERLAQVDQEIAAMRVRLRGGCVPLNLQAAGVVSASSQSSSSFGARAVTTRSSQNLTTAGCGGQRNPDGDACRVYWPTSVQPWKYSVSADRVEYRVYWREVLQSCCRAMC